MSDDIVIPEEHAQGGSLAKGLAGEYSLSIGEVISEAWNRVSGNKGTVWIALLIYMAAIFVISLILNLVLGTEPPPATGEGAAMATSPKDQVQQLLTTLLITPLWIGTIFLGVAIASDKPAKATSICSWYGKMFKLFLTYILMGLLILLGLVLLVLPGIYLAIAYQLALPLVADKDLGPWEALETSRKIVTHKWFSFFILWFVLALAVAASMVLLGIPLIWVLPACIIGIGIVYRNAIGAETATLQKVAGD